MADNIEPILLNVRRAYRLLNAYHRRVLDTTRTIGDVLDKRFDYWYSMQTWPTRSASSRILTSYLGGMPLQYEAFVFRPTEGTPKPGQWLLEVKHWGDSAYDGNEGAYDPTLLGPVETSVTQLGLSAGVVMAGMGTSWYNFWENAHYPEDISDPKEVAGHRVWEGTTDGCTARVVRLFWSVAEFGSEELVRKRCQEIRAAAEAILAAP